MSTKNDVSDVTLRSGTAAYTVVSRYDDKPPLSYTCKCHLPSQYPVHTPVLTSEPRCCWNVCLLHYRIHTFIHSWCHLPVSINKNYNITIINTDLDLWPPNLKTFSAMPTQMTNIHGNFHWNTSTKCTDITACKTGVNGQTMDNRWTNGRPENTMPLLSNVGRGINSNTCTWQGALGCVYTSRTLFQKSHRSLFRQMF